MNGLLHLGVISPFAQSTVTYRVTAVQPRPVELSLKATYVREWLAWNINYATNAINTYQS